MGKETDRIRSNFAKELERAELHDTLTDALDSFGPVTNNGKLFLHPLFGKAGTLKFGDSYGHEALSFKRAVSLINALPAESLMLNRSGGTSFQPAEYVAKLDANHQENCTEVSPVVVHVTGFQGPYMEIKWLTRLAGNLIDVELNMGYPDLAICQYKAVKTNFNGGSIYRSNDCKLSIEQSVSKIYLEKENLVAMLASPIKWAQGSDEYPNKFSFYWEPVGTERNQALIGDAIMRTLRDSCKAKK